MNKLNVVTKAIFLDKENKLLKQELAKLYPEIESLRAKVIILEDKIKRLEVRL